MSFRVAVVLAMALLTSCGGDTGDPAGVAPAAAPPVVSRSPAAAAEYDLVEMTLPSGDATAGRQAFIDLRCTGCHRVVGEPDLPSPISDSGGPDLGPELAAQPLGLLATSVVAPSHAMSIRTSPDTRERVDGVLSPMGDYSEVMTVSQLLDLLAFLDRVRQ